MSAQTDVVNAFFDAVDQKDIDRALTYFTDEAVVESPMGPKKGKGEIRELLQMMSSMPGGGGRPTVSESGDSVIAKMSGPMGPMTLGFEFSGGLISRQTTQMG